MWFHSCFRLPPSSYTSSGNLGIALIIIEVNDSLLDLADKPCENRRDEPDELVVSKVQSIHRIMQCTFSRLNLED